MAHIYAFIPQYHAIFEVEAEAEVDDDDDMEAADASGEMHFLEGLEEVDEEPY